MHRAHIATLVFSVTIFIQAPWTIAVPPSPPSKSWIQQFGSNNDDFGLGITTGESGSIYVSGYTLDSVDGPNLGIEDMYLRKFDSSGALLWGKQYGTNHSDYGGPIFTNRMGKLFVAGNTYGNFGGVNASGGSSTDAFIADFDATGAMQSVRQLGTDKTELAQGIVADVDGGVYVGGLTRGNLAHNLQGTFDAYVAKYGPTGSPTWIDQFSSNNSDNVNKLAIDASGNVYACGDTRGNLSGMNLGRSDVFIRKYTSSGTVLWTQQFGTTQTEECNSIAVDSDGGVFVCGYTSGLFGSPSPTKNFDIFVCKYDTNGGLLWTRQFGTTKTDVGIGVVADGLGGVYFVGLTEGALANSNAGGHDVFFGHFDTSGILLWTDQFGTIADDDPGDVAIDDLGNLYIVGTTRGSLGGPSVGIRDAFVAKFSPVPEPSTMALAALAGLCCLAIAFRRKRDRVASH